MFTTPGRTEFLATNLQFEPLHVYPCSRKQSMYTHAISLPSRDMLCVGLCPDCSPTIAFGGSYGGEPTRVCRVSLLWSSRHRQHCSDLLSTQCHILHSRTGGFLPQAPAASSLNACRRRGTAHPPSSGTYSAAASCVRQTCARARVSLKVYIC